MVNLKADITENMLAMEKIDSKERMNDNPETDIRPMNEEQRKVIVKLEEVLHFLKSALIKNEEAFLNIKKPMDDLQSCLKYLPTEPSFDILPTEIKMDILEYLCDSEAFVAASVCQDWKKILESRFSKKMRLGKHCPQCKDNECFKPDEMLNASTVHRLDVHLTVCHPIKEVSPELVADGLTSVDSFTITSDCNCGSDFSGEILTLAQLEMLFEGIEKKVEVMEKVEFEGIDLMELNQERAVNCLVTKVKKLKLHMGHRGIVLDAQTLFRKLEQNSTKIKLTHLKLGNWRPSYDLSFDLADVLCQIENVEMAYNFQLNRAATKRLFQNILSQPIKIKSLKIEKNLDFYDLINTEDLRILFNKLEAFQMKGKLNSEQLDIVRSLTDDYVPLSTRAGEIAHISQGEMKTF